MPGVSDAVADADRIRQTAIEVLQRPDYDLESVENYGKFIDWLWDLLRPIFDFFDALYDWSPIVFGIMIFVLLALLVAIVWHIVYSLRTAMRRRKAPGDYDVADEVTEALPETWESRANAAYGEQNYLMAVRYLLHAGLLRLEAGRKGHLRRGATNREYLRRYRNTAVYDPLALMVEITDSRWFGGIPCTQQDAEQCMQALTELRRTSMSEAEAENADAA